MLSSGLNFWSRLVTVFAALAIGAFLLFTLLFSPPTLAKEPVTLSLLMFAFEIPIWQPLVQDFEQANPDIHLRLVEGPSSPDLLEDLSTTAFLLGNSPYDLVYMDVTWTPKFAAAGWLMDLSDRLSATELSEFLPDDIAAGRYQNKLYRLPIRGDSGVLYYRRDLLEQSGYQPPQTFAEMVNISQSLQQQGRVKWGYLWQGRQYEGVVAMFVEVLKGFGGFWIDPKTEMVGLDRPEAVQAVEFLVNTIDQGISPPGVVTYREEETRFIFQAKEAAFLRSWPYVWTLANLEDSPVRGKFAMMPMVHSPGQVGSVCKGGWGLGIAKTTTHPAEAWRAIQFLISLESQRKIALAAGYSPSRPVLYTDAAMMSKYPHFPKLLEVAENTVLRPLIPQYAQASDILQRYLTAAFTKRLPPKDAMAAAAKETHRLLGQSVR